MAEFLHFSRDSRMYLVKDNRAWFIPILDGFSFSQATNASEITLNEMEDSSGRSRRGRKMFTDSLSAAEFSFSTYARPFKHNTAYNASGNLATGGGGAGKAGNGSAANMHAVEEALWVCMGSKNDYNTTTYAWNHGTSGGAITSLTMTTPGTARPANQTYTIAVPGTGVTIGSNGSNVAASAVVTVTTDGSGAATAVITDRGIGFRTGATITIAQSQLGGQGGNMVLTVTSEAFTTDTTDLDINFFDSNRSSLSTFDLYFVLSDRSAGLLVYKIANSVINEASIDFDIDGIATINWSGFGSQITDFTSSVTVSSTTPSATAAGQIFIDTDENYSFYVSSGSGSTKGTHWHHTIDEGTKDTGNFLRNRLTQLTLAPDATFDTNNTDVDYEDSYEVAITSGNITISNNITFLTPEEIGRVNQPIEHVTGTRTVTGSFNCYLGSSDAATNKSKNLFEDLVQDTETVINEFELQFNVGGTGATPGLEFKIDRCHLEIPSHSIDDVISLETNFHGLGSSIGEADEIVLKYRGPQSLP